MPPASAATCQKVEGVIGYQFSNRNLLCKALLADPNGRVYFGSRYMVEADKQIAMVGHPVMGLVVFERAYEGNKLHAKMEEQCQRVLRTDNLNAKGRSKGLVEHLQHDEGVKAITAQMMAMAVKAILGAVWLDSKDIGAVKQVMVRLTLFDALSPLERD